MKFRKNIYAISISAAMLALAGCGITPQDEGLGDSKSKPMSGVVVDGYLAGATVYVDVNENNKLDAWETRALTDMRGYFSYRPAYTKNGTDFPAINYCEIPDSIHCLKAPAGYSEVMVRMTQGYDLATAEPFTGTISMRMNVESAVVTSPVAATPITGLLAEVPAADMDAFLVNEGLTNDISKADFLDFENSLTGPERRLLFTLALQAHKISDVVAGELDILYGTANGSTGFFGVNESVPVDASSYVYKAMVSEAIRTGDTLNTILTNAVSMQLVIEEAIANINQYVIDEFNDRLPQDLVTEQPENPADMLQPIAIGDVAAGTDAKMVTLASTIESVFTAVLATETFTDSQSVVFNYTVKDDTVSRLRAIDAVVWLMKNNGTTGEITNAVDLATTDAVYLTNLKHPAVNMASLKSKFKAGVVVTGDSNFAARKSFNQLVTEGSSPFTATEAGAQVNSEGFGGNRLALDSPDGDAVSVDFGGAGDDTSGDVTIDASFLGGDFAKKDEAGNTVPLELEGTWEKVDDYTMIMNIEVTDGVFEPVIVKPNDDGSGYYFDLGGEQVVWQ